MRYLAVILLLMIFIAVVLLATLFLGKAFYVINKGVNLVATTLNHSKVANISSDFYAEKNYGGWINIYNIILFAALVIAILALFIYTKRR